MLISKTAIVKWNSANRKYYESKGYIFTNYKDEFEVDIQDLSKYSSAEVLVKCDYCGKEKYITFERYNVGTKSGTQKYACSDCQQTKTNELHAENRNRKSFSKLMDEFQKRGYTPISAFEDYNGVTTKIKYICPIHGEQETTYDYIVNGKHGCPECGKVQSGINQRIQKDELIQIFNEKGATLLNPEGYKEMHIKNLRVLCAKCKEEFITSLNLFLTSTGLCSSCGYKHVGEMLRLTPDEVERTINAVNNNTLLNKEEYINAKEANLRIRCSCGEEFTTSLVNYKYSKVNRCKSCSKRESSGELAIRRVLEKYNISYTPEYKFQDCRDILPLPFDFYIHDNGSCIEFDGQQHFLPIYGEDSLLKTQKHDAIKTQYCLNNNISLLRIPYYEGHLIEERVADFIRELM